MDIHFKDGSFYIDSISGSPPKGALAVTEEQWAACMRAQREPGQEIYAGTDGMPAVRTRVLSPELAAECERNWRTSQLRSTDHFVMPDYPIEMTQAQEVVAYRAALRDYPSTPGFPNGRRPEAPAWLSKGS
jgi:hypothetical protein